MILFVAGFVLGGSAVSGSMVSVVLTDRWEVQEEIRAGGRHTVVVARTARHAGHTIRADDAVEVRVPILLLPEGVFMESRHVVGRVVRDTVYEGEMIVGDRLR